MPDAYGQSARWSGAGNAMLRWWGAELATCLPFVGVLRRLSRVGTLVLRAGEDAWSVARESPAGLIERGSVSIAALAGAEGAERLRALIGGDRRARLVVELPQERALRKTLRLPAAAQTDLAKVLEFEVERQTPFPASQVYFAHRVLGPAGGGATLGGPLIEVDLVAVPRAVVDAITLRLAALGLAADAVTVAGKLGAAATRLTLLESAQAVERGRVWTRTNRRLLGAVLLLAIAAALSPLAANYVAGRALEQEIAALGPKVRAILAEREQRQRAQTLLDDAIRIKTQTPSGLRLLDELTRALPDDAWLTHLSLSGRELVIDGVAGSAAALVRPLEASPSVARVVFRAPITREPTTQLERFQFAIELKEPRP